MIFCLAALIDKINLSFSALACLSKLASTFVLSLSKLFIVLSISFNPKPKSTLFEISPNCFYQMCRHIKFVFRKLANRKVVLVTLMMPVLFLLEIVNGTFVVVLFQGIETAFILAVVFSKTKNKDNAN